MSRETRLERILDIISHDPSVNRDEIEIELGRKANEIGFVSEARVKKVLENLPFIMKIRQTERGSWEDMAGRDLICYFSNLNTVGIQVKSSAGAIYRFIEKGNLDHIGLMEKKLILINGLRDEDFIKHVFLKRLFEIDDYWARYKGKRILPHEVRRQKWEV